jgi:hypothetical protein
VDPEFRETQEKTPPSHSEQFKTTSEGDFPIKIKPSKLYQILCRSIAYCIDYGIGFVIGLLYYWFYVILATVIVGQENFNYLTYIPNSVTQFNAYGNWISVMLLLAGIIFWISIIDIFRIRSPGKALVGLKIYWTPDKMNSDKWKIIRTLIKNAPFLTLFMGLIIYNTQGSLVIIIGLILGTVWIFSIIFTAKSQSIHDRIVGTVVYFE